MGYIVFEIGYLKTIFKISFYKSKMRTLTSGQIKLSISFSEQKLDIHVQEAHGLQSEWSPQCNAFVQAEICESDVTSSRPQTKIIPNSNSPVFDEHLIHTLRPTDEKKRLLISVWHSDQTRTCSEFLGCLSFGLRHLIAKCTRTKSTDKERMQFHGVQGWYYLLSADIGHRKHLLANRKFQDQEFGVSRGCNREGEDKENQQHFDFLSFTLKHRGAGYGFTVRGPHPTRVGRVKVGGPAAEMGLRTGDVILKVNNQPINDQDIQHVAYTIRTSLETVVIDVKRRPSFSSAEKHIHNTPTQSSFNTKSREVSSSYSGSASKKPKLDSENKLSEIHLHRSIECEKPLNSYCSQMNCYSNASVNNQNKFKEGMFCKPCEKLMLPMDNSYCTSDTNFIKASNSCEHVTSINNQLYEKTKSNQSDTLDYYENGHLKWTPDMSSISPHRTFARRFIESVSSFDQHLMGLSHLTSYRDLAELASEQNSCSFLNIGHVESEVLKQSVSQDDKSLPLRKSVNTTMSEIKISSGDENVPPQCSPGNKSHSFYDATDFENDMHISHECSLASERTLQKDLCIRTFINCEATFVEMMQRGIQAYSRPLRVCVTAQQKELLFQNIEKLAALSRFNLTQLQSETKRETSMDSTHEHLQHSQLAVQDIGHAYQATVEMLCAAYKDYIAGLGTAVKLLRSMLTQSSFITLVQTQRKCCDMDLVDFLQQPVVHFEFMRRSFTQLLLHTDEQSLEYGQVTKILGHFENAYRQLMK